METLSFLVSDKVIFPLFEGVFAALFIYAVLRGGGWFVRQTGINATVKRGAESWSKFNLAFGIASVVLMQIINSADALQGYKTIISILNLAMLLYLAFFNSWFRNRMLGIIIKSQEMEERY